MNRRIKIKFYDKVIAFYLTQMQPGWETSVTRHNAKWSQIASIVAAIITDEHTTVNAPPRSFAATERLSLWHCG